LNERGQKWLKVNQKVVKTGQNGQNYPKTVEICSVSELKVGREWLKTG
jgi:hypothetical protein